MLKLKQCKLSLSKFAHALVFFLALSNIDENFVKNFQIYGGSSGSSSSSKNINKNENKKGK